MGKLYDKIINTKELAKKVYGNDIRDRVKKDAINAGHTLSVGRLGRTGL